MKNRSADAALAGYYYQFDKTILSLLELAKANNSVTIEGVEDIDIEGQSFTAVQCKYLTSKKYSLAAIRKPILLMLDDFITRAVPINYRLFVYFGEKLPAPPNTLSLPQLKDALTYTSKGKNSAYHIDKSISDPVLTNFLQNFSIEEGQELNEQRNLVFSKLKKQFSCSEDECDLYYYNSAIRFVFQSATESDSKKRIISKSQFIKKIDSRELLFNKWYQALRGREKYLSLIKKSLKATEALAPNHKRCLYINVSEVNSKESTISLNRLIVLRAVSWRA
jgi:hypothetical protein